MRWVITIQCWPHVGFTYGSNAPTRLQAFRAARRAHQACELRRIERIEIEDGLTGETWAYGHVRECLPYPHYIGSPS